MMSDSFFLISSLSKEKTSKTFLLKKEKNKVQQKSSILSKLGILLIHGIDPWAKTHPSGPLRSQLA